jgi:hemerythrin-like domain-containing protein
MEEQAFYHSLANLQETNELIKGAYEEHRKVDELLVKMTTAKNWKPLLGDLKAQISHHVQEEEGELFPHAERLLPQNLLKEMGRQLENMKEGKAAIA